MMYYHHLKASWPFRGLTIDAGEEQHARLVESITSKCNKY